VDEKPESIEISPGDSENPWEQPSDNAASGGALLSGNVASFGGQEGDSPYWEGANEASKGPSNGAWFAIGLILVPIALWIANVILFNIGDATGADEEFFIILQFILYPATLIGGVVWGFTKGNKYFAWGVLTSLVAVPVALFAALIVFLILAFGL
tara:strand:+ start:177 stop:641 length:465 start_codon:yes stop_codon:yes gene_type:complete